MNKLFSSSRTTQSSAVYHQSLALRGFTIVELLVVIVVIGILAAITIVSYTGISQKAIVASIQSDLSGASNRLKMYYVENGQYPQGVNYTTGCPTTPVDDEYCLKSSSGNTFSNYSSTTPYQTFTLDATNTNTTKYRITNDSAPVAATSTPTPATQGPLSPGTIADDAGTTGNIITSEDSYVDSANPTTNFGTQYYCTSSYRIDLGIQRAIYKFNVTVPAGAIINSATLSITTYDNYAGSPANIGVYPVTDNSWTEGGVTWNNQPSAGTLIQSFSTAYNAGTVNYNVTTFVNTQLGAGGSIPISFIQKLTDETVTQGIRWKSRENTGVKPILVVNYSTVGTVAWSNPNNAMASDSVYATAIMPSTPSKVHYLKATNFGFSIPAGAIINGILVEITEHRGAYDIFDDEIKIVKSDGTIGTTNKSTGALLPTSLPSPYVPYGSSSDLWGETWAYSDINDVDFGFVYSVSSVTAGSTKSVFIDHIRITVYYTTP